MSLPPPVVGLPVDRDNNVPLSVQRTQVTWLDVNTRLKQNGQPELLSNASAINNAVENLFSCPVGARGPIFEPEFGSNLYALLQEPIDDESAFAIRASLVQSLERWEPRINVVHNQTIVTPVQRIVGYHIVLVYQVRGTPGTQRVNFTVQRN